MRSRSAALAGRAYLEASVLTALAVAIGQIPHHKVGKHRRIHFNDLMVYKDRSDLATAQGLDEMVAISQELGLYD